MSAKQAILDRVRTMADSATWEEIVHHLNVNPTDFTNVEYDEPSEDEWRLIMAHAFAEELANPAEDLYQDVLEVKSS